MLARRTGWSIGTFAVVTMLLISLSVSGETPEEGINPIQPGTNFLATAPLAIPEFGDMECSVVNLHPSDDITVTTRLILHFRNPPLPGGGFEVSKTEILMPGEASSLANSVGSDPALGRCTFDFSVARKFVRGAAAVLTEAFFGCQGSDCTLVNGRAVAVSDAK